MSKHLLVLLPPSETKTDGGNSQFPAEFRYTSLASTRERCLADLVALSSGPGENAAKSLKISAKLAETELARNRALRTAPLRPAVERYTGVLFDALDAGSLSDPASEWLRAHVAVHSALYGLVMAGEGIAAYRLSHNSRLPGEPLKKRWRDAIRNILAAHEGPILDLRSKGYVDLGPLPAGRNRAWANVAQRQADGTLKSLNHFNKQAKGVLVRLLAERLAEQPEVESLAGLADVVSDRFAFTPGPQGTVDIVQHPTAG